jgi:hypothetical protein
MLARLRRALPVLAPTGNGISGRITNDSGGSTKAEVVAICLGG